MPPAGAGSILSRTGGCCPPIRRRSREACFVPSSSISSSWRLAFAITSWLLDGHERVGRCLLLPLGRADLRLVNAILGTILRILTLPLTLITLGLFSIVVNAVLLEITDAITDHLTIDSFFWTAIWAAIILSVVTVVLQLILGSVMKRQESA